MLRPSFSRDLWRSHCQISAGRACQTIARLRVHGVRFPGGDETSAVVERLVRYHASVRHRVCRNSCSGHPRIAWHFNDANTHTYKPFVFRIDCHQW